MGIYQYTLRAPIRNAAGIRLGQFKFAYKCGWNADRSRVAQSLLAAGERAVDKLEREGVKLFVQGDWHDEQPVYWMESPISTFTEELRTTPRVGTLYKNDRGRWYVKFASEHELLQKFPEIGTLQTETGKQYYFMRDGRDIRFDSLQRAMREALSWRLVSPVK